MTKLKPLQAKANLLCCLKNCHFQIIETFIGTRCQKAPKSSRRTQIQIMKTLKLKLAALALTGLSGVLLPVAAQAANEKVCFEAEGASSVVKPVKIAKPGSNKKYSGKGYVDIPWDKNKSKGIGSATIYFNVQKAGTYYLWARTFWANGCGNSIGGKVNGGGTITLGEDGTYDKWHWVGGKTRVKLKAGRNKFVITNRETGVRADQIFLCTDKNYTPTGIRKIES